MKRNQPENGLDACSAVVGKHRKTDIPSLHEEEEEENEIFLDDGEAAQLEPFLNDFEEIQKELQDLDEECAREQMLIQKRYDEKKKPIFEKRQKIIDQIPGFWGRTFRRHPALACMVEEDTAILQCLKDIQLDDNLDDNGSYKITFHFTEEAKEYMNPLVLIKHVVFKENGEEEVKFVTNISWKEGKSPIDIAEKLRKEQNSRDASDEVWSFFEWFTTDWSINRADLGEVIRREIWHAPLAYCMDHSCMDDNDDVDVDDIVDDEKDEDEDEDVEENVEE